MYLNRITLLLVEDGVVAVVLDSDVLEQNMYKKIREWEERRQQLEEKRQQVCHVQFKEMSLISLPLSYL